MDFKKLQEKARKNNEEQEQKMKSIEEEQPEDDEYKTYKINRSKITHVPKNDDYVITRKTLFKTATTYIENGIVPLVCYPYGCCKEKKDKDGHLVRNKYGDIDLIDKKKNPVGCKYQEITLVNAMAEFESRYNYFKKLYPNREPWMGIRTGLVSDITVVDVDMKDEGMSKWRELVKENGKPKTCSQRSRSGGKHLVFKYDGGNLTTASKYGGVGIDIRNDNNGLIIVEPSGDDEGRYQWLVSPLEYDIPEIPEWLVEWLNSNPAGDGKHKKKKKHVDTKTTDDVLFSIFNKLKVERFGAREAWMRLGFLCKSLDRKDIFEHISKNAPKYDAVACDELYNSAKDNCSNPITLSTLWYWLREDYGNDECDRLMRQYAMTVVEAVGVGEKFNIARLDITECRKLCFNNESGLTDIMINMYRGRVICVGKSSKPAVYAWNGKFWENKGKTLLINIIREFIPKVVRNVIAYVDALLNKDKDNEKLQNEVEELYKLLTKAQSCNCVEHISTFMICALTDDTFLEKKLDALEHSKYLITCNNGIINLKTKELLKHDPKYYLSKHLDVDYVEGYDGTDVNKFFDNITLNNAKLKKCLQRLLGYFLTGERIEQYFYFFNGSGSNGKSKTIDLLTEVMGKCADGGFKHSGNTDLIIKGLVKKSGASPEMMPLRGCHLLTIGESEDDDKLDTGRIKKMTGDDTTTGRDLYCGIVEFQNKFKSVLITNTLPILRADDDALARRIVNIPFNAKFATTHPTSDHDILYNPEDPTHILRDNKLIARIRANLSNIFGWQVDGAFDWYQKFENNGESGLYIPECVKVATNTYLNENDNINKFINEYCDKNSKHEERTRVLFDSYRRHYDSISETKFAGLLEKKGYTTRKSHGIMMRVGLKLKSDDNIF